jgi:hypothetical protein
MISRDAKTNRKPIRLRRFNLFYSIKQYNLVHCNRNGSLQMYEIQFGKRWKHTDNLNVADAWWNVSHAKMTGM